MARCVWLCLLSVVLTACGGGGGSSQTAATVTTTDTAASTATLKAFDWQLPPGFPLPNEEAENRMTTEKVELGRRLFYDTRLSANGTQSCGSCHHQNKAFTDGLVQAVGSTGETHPRNSMSLTNVVYNSRFNWVNPLLDSLRKQAFVPMFAEFPVELGWTGHEQEILDRLRVDPIYRDLFVKAFPDAGDTPISEDTVIKAISAFVSTMISGNSAYDKALYQNQVNATSESAKRGLALFFSERLECFHCHGGFNFAQGVDHAGVVFDQAEFHNNGLYNIGGTGAYPLDSGGLGAGLWDFTGKQEDIGRFKPPSLRNIELTAPYMHDGSVATLEDVIDMYARGGRLIADGPYAGDGAKNPYKSDLLLGFVLTPEEKTDVINFLKSLTDWEFVCDPRFSDPYGNIPPHERCL